MFQMAYFYEQYIKTLLDHMNDFIRLHDNRYTFQSGDIRVFPVYDEEGLKYCGIIIYEDKK